MSGTVLVTGAAGFIGSHLCEALVARGDRVVGVDNFDPFYDRANKQANADAVAAAAGDSPGTFELLEADLNDQDRMTALFGAASPDTVVHLAAKAGVRPSIADPVGYARANITATAGLMSLAETHGVSTLVIASSSSVYGNNDKTPFGEDDPVEHPISPYAATKRACELIAHTHHHLTGMPTAMLRFFTVFGPRQRPDLAINKFMRRVAQGEPITMFGDGSTSRDYTFIEDIIRGIFAAMDRIGDHGYRIWNLGGDHPMRLDELIAAIGDTVGREPVVERAPMQPGDVERTWADLTRAKADLGYACETPVREGLSAQWAWLKGRL
ncbi:MAG: NAD-dependent epimerase/dehydratase family protein [Planctomycetota bacterium]